MGLLSGCGSDDTDAVAEYDRRVEIVDEQLRAVTRSVIGELGGRIDGAGVGAHQVCGLGPPFSGPQYRAVAVLRRLGADQAGKLDAFRSALEDAEWVVEQPTSDTIEATRDSLTVRVQTGAAATQVTMQSGCVETSSSTAEEIADRPTVDLQLS